MSAPGGENKIPNHNGDGKKIFSVVVIFAVLIISFSVAVYFYLEKQKAEISVLEKSAKTNLNGKSGLTNSPSDINAADGNPSEPKIYQDKLVQWYAAPKAVANPDIFSGKDAPQQYKTWETGEIMGGAYQGQKIYLIISEPYGPGDNLVFRFIGANNKKLTFLSKYSNDDILGSYSLVNKNVVTGSDSSFDITSLDYPDTIVLENSKIKKDQDFPASPPDYDDKGNMIGDQFAGSFFDNSLLKKISSDPIYGDIYVTDPTKINKSNSNAIFAQNGFYLKASDGTFKVYSMVVDILSDKNIPDITWNDGTKPSAKYTYHGINGCGGAVYVDDVAESNLRSEDLVQIGKTSSGDPVYGVQDRNYKYLKDWYGENMKLIGDFAGDTGVKFRKSTTYQQFLDNHPMFFWRDSLGRLLRFLNTDMVVSGGCGKPVIYLYPKSKTNVDVKVTPTSGMSVSEPAYNGGWNVEADPDSRIKNLADGKTYSYLYWEGRADSVYRMPFNGFVTSQDNLENFLNEKLAQLGLIGKEIKDFKDFWLPRMMAENKPYYFVTFNSRQTIDKLAPLEINPQPDTVIRVLMDYKGLDRPMEVPGFEISTPKRQGFTVVEWGGVLK